jgi:hypothetical protein
MFLGMKMNDGRDQSSALFPLTESPAVASGIPPGVASSPRDTDRAHSLGGTDGRLSPRTDRRSPLGRKVVTALEAELNEVRIGNFPTSGA